MPPGDYRKPPEGQSQPLPREQAPAVVALLDHAEQQANSGDLPAAAMTLERAIRIDSRNPVLWHHLASVRLAEGNAEQAEQLARKSNALAAGNYALQARNWGLIAEARRARGDADGAQSAERQKQALQAR
jgi:Tfp pilus assembly protein PilF